MELTRDNLEKINLKDFGLEHIRRRADDGYAVVNKHIVALRLQKTEVGIQTLEFGEEAQYLKYIYLSGNTNLKEIVFKNVLPELELLYADNTGISEIIFPAGFKELQQIYLQKSLSLSKIVFKADCPNLILMDLVNNAYLAELSISQVFSKLEYLYLRGSSLKNIPREITEKDTNCAGAVMNYLRASFYSGDIINNEAKCIFFGNSGAGKTTLSHQLRLNEFDTKIESTHGILIYEWLIDAKEFPENLKEKINLELMIDTRDYSKFSILIY